MAGYNVGEADVTIVPNADRFNEELAAKLLPGAEAAGREIGDKIAEEIRLRLARVGDLNLGVDTEKASFEVDKFLAETDAKAKVAGDEAGRSLGNNLSKSAADSGRGGSGLIIAAISGGLMAGAPAMLGAAGILFGGIAAAAVHSNKQVTDAFAQTGNDVTNTLKSAAQVTVPYFTSALQRIGVAVQGLGPQFRTAFSWLDGPINSLTTGLIGLAQGVMPGLVAAMRAADPVFAGLASLLTSVGTGLGQFFQIIAQHGSAAGTVFSSLGSIISALLPILGQLVGAGAELGAQILPPIAAVLHVVADALNLVAPLLPAVALGFLAFKSVGLVNGLLDTFAQKLAFASYGSGNFAGMAGKASSAVSGLSSAMPYLGAVLTGFVTIQQRVTDQSKQWAQALLDGGKAAQTAGQQMSGLGPAMNATNTGMGGFISNLIGLGVPAGNAARALDGVKKAQKDLYDALSPLEQKQQDVKKATNDLELAQSKYGVGSSQAAAAARKVVAAQGAQKAAQDAITAATNAALDPEAKHAAALQAIADKASAGTTEISLLKGALDALTGKAITADQATIAITQAINNAITATKGQTGALLDANGHLDLYTAKGSAAAQALIQLASDQHKSIAVMEQQGASAGKVSAATDAMRTQFIHVARQMGINDAEAKILADRYFGIPKDVNTRIRADTAQAVAAITGVQRLMSTLHDKTITTRVVTSYDNGTQTVHQGVGATLGAIGGIVHAYAGGGIEPMQGGIAQIVPPNRLRVIGDRVADDEAYIPINKDLRSIAIWQQAGQRMGMLGSGSSGGGGSTKGSFTGNLYLDSGEFLGKVRGEAESVMAGALNDHTARGNFNP